MNRREYLASHLGLVARLCVPSLAFTVAGCGAGRPAVATLEGRTMGTAYRVTALVDPAEVGSLGEDVAAIVARVDGLMSTYRPASELSRFNVDESVGWVAVSADTHAVFAEAGRASRLTAGAFDVTVGPLVNLWGFGPAGAARTVPADEAIADVAARVGHAKLEASSKRLAVRKAHPGVYADLSGIAKGYAVDLVARRLDTRGVESYLLDIGGELRARGRRPDGGPWRVGIERPISGRREPMAVVALEDRAIATSGDYRNFFELQGARYSHAIDPATGRPADHALASVSVIAATTIEADALSTAMMVMGPERGLALATERELAAQLLVKSADGLLVHRTAAFTALLA